MSFALHYSQIGMCGWILRSRRFYWLLPNPSPFRLDWIDYQADPVQLG